MYLPPATTPSIARCRRSFSLSRCAPRSMNRMGTPDGLVCEEDLRLIELHRRQVLRAAINLVLQVFHFVKTISRRAAAASNEPRIGEIDVFRLVSFAIGKGVAVKGEGQAACRPQHCIAGRRIPLH